VPAELIPRWEWRTFGSDLGAGDERLAGLTPEREQDSDDVYLLSANDEATVKLRDEVMDVKRLERVDDEGLEQWLPVLKASFPLSTEDAGSVFEALGANAPTGEVSSFDDVRRIEDVLVVRVHKHRRRYTIAGCMAELTDVDTDHGATRTIAVESEDPALVLAALQELGLESRRNVNYVHGLSALAGFGSRRFAVIDVGTNSVKFHVGERRRDGAWTTVVDRAEITRLGEGLDAAGELRDEPMERTAAAIADMAGEARDQAAEAIAAVGTAGLRIASNAEAFLRLVRERCGVEIEVISGDEEARLAYRAATAGLGPSHETRAVFDTGGGSSQFTFGEGDRIDEQFSVDVGAARFTERFGLDQAVSEETLHAALDAIGDDLERLEGRPAPAALLGMGGAVTNIAAVLHALPEYDRDVVQGTVLDRDEVDRQLELYRTRSAEERAEIPGLQPKRAGVILAGTCVVRTVLEKLGADSLTVSDHGLRHGLLVERFGS
jgi:exopolyphosphatase/guanosine-5'-triphosphate,3'-diphosphate pyrophosphatase